MTKDSKIYIQNSEEQLILDSILDSIWSIDTNYKLKTFNAFFKKRNFKYTGFKAKKGALIKNINPEHFETFWKPKYDKVFLGESMIFEYLSPDKKYFEIKLYPNFKDDQIIGLTAIGIDLTKLIYAQNQLKKSEERFRLFTDIGSEGIAIHQDGKTMDVNKRFTKMLNYSLDELMALTLRDLVYPDDLKMTRDHIDMGYKEPYEIRLVKKGGDIFYANVIGKNIIYKGEKARVASFYDISNIKKAELALVETYNIVSTSPLVIFHWKNDYYWNTAFVTENVNKLLGYSASEFLSGKASYKDIIHPEDFDRVTEETLSYSKSKMDKVFMQEYRVITKDGTIKWVRDFPSVRRDKNNQITHFDGVIHDISEQKKIQSDLIESEEKFRVIVRDQTEMIVRWKPGGIRTFANEAYYNFFKLKKEVVQGTGFFPLLNENDIAKLKKRLKSITPDNPISTAIHSVHYPVGYICWQEWSHRGFFDKDGKIIDYQSTGRDITKRMKIEQALKESEEKFKEIFEKSSDALSIIKNGIFIDCNFATCKMLGYSTKKEFLDLNTNPFNISPKVQPDGSDSFKKGQEYLKATYEKGSQLFEWVHTKKNGENFSVEVLLSVISNEPDNKILYCVWRDISERKKSEEKQAKYRIQLEEENIYLKNEVGLSFNYEDIVYSSEEISDVLTQVEQVSNTNATVLILGETGTGKELIAKAIHNTSDRKNNPLIRVNCAAIPSELIESELFGHIKGSFTGAIKNRIGKFELANKGSLFLDEIGEIPLLLQSKLLRAIQEGEIDPVGSSETRKLDVRIIAATNKDLRKEAEEKRFREDLFFRLNVFPITIPPLRDRIEDIPALIDHFVNKYCLKYGKEIKYISDVTLQQMKSYSWPGNIRELENLIERAVIISGQDLLLIREFESSAQNKTSIKKSSNTLEEIQRNHIIKILNKTQWKIGGKEGAAMILDIKPSTLRDRMKKLGIKRP